jgi:DNA polymerase-1
MKDTRPVMLIDAYNMFIRNFSANPLMADGQHVGGVVGFLQSLNTLLQNHSPKECVIVWEGGGSTRRRNIFPDYKTKRRPVKLNRFYEGDIPDTVENRNWQIKFLVHLLMYLPIKQLYVSDCEADDVIGYLAKYSFSESNVLIVSSDHDYLQLVDDRVKIWSPTLKSLVTRETVKEKFGIWPHNFLVVRCFCGDISDALPGIKGVGMKTMIKRFPQLAGDDEVDIDDIITYANENAKGGTKVYELVKTNANLGKMNWRLMRLDVSNLSGNQVSKVNGIIESPLPSIKKFDFIRALLKVGIKTFDVDRLFLNVNLNLKRRE